MRGGCSFGGEPRLVVMMGALVIDSSTSGAPWLAFRYSAKQRAAVKPPEKGGQRVKELNVPGVLKTILQNEARDCAWQALGCI